MTVHITPGFKCASGVLGSGLALFYCLNTISVCLFRDCSHDIQQLIVSSAIWC